MQQHPLDISVGFYIMQIKLTPCMRLYTVTALSYTLFTKPSTPMEAWPGLVLFIAREDEDEFDASHGNMHAYGGFYDAQH